MRGILTDTSEQLVIYEIELKNICSEMGSSFKNEMQPVNWKYVQEFELLLPFGLWNMEALSVSWMKYLKYLLNQ